MSLQAVLLLVCRLYKCSASVCSLEVLLFLCRHACGCSPHLAPAAAMIPRHSVLQKQCCDLVQYSHSIACTGVNVDSPQTWLQLLKWDPFIKLAPAVVSTLLLMLVMSRFKSPWALPAILILIPGVFFVVLACLHKSLAQAQDGGWVAKPEVRQVTRNDLSDRFYTVMCSRNKVEAGQPNLK